MKIKKGSLLFLFLCLMGVLTVSSPISPLHHDSIGVVYAEEEEEEEDDAPAPATGSNGNYENLQVPAILSTAYADGLRLAELDETSASEEGEASKVFYDNMKLLINNPDTAGKYQFDTIGVFMGPIGQSSGSGTNDVASTLSIGLPQLKSEYSFGHDLGEAYWTFGRAVQNLRNDASKADTGTINATAAIDALAGISTQVSNIGLRLLRDWSPAPVVLAFTDSAVLYQPEYQSNELIKMVHQVDTARNMISFFGNPVPGIPLLSYSQLITLMLIMLGLVVSILTIFIGDKLFPKTVKQTFVKVMVMIVAVPLTMNVYDWGLQTLDAVAGSATQTTEYQQARSHLLLGRWAEKGFAVPQGRTLTVQDGRFILSRDDIHAINAMLVGSNDDQTIADEITRQVSADNNETNISWQAVTSGVYHGRPWQTNRIIEIATAIGNGQPVEENTDANLADNNVGYLYGSGLRSHRGTNGNFTYTQNGAHSFLTPYLRFGIGPVASYNLLNTSFNTNGLSVKSNLSTGSSLPSVAPNAYAYNIGGVGAGNGQAATPMTGPVKWLVQFTLMIASIKALAKILTTGFGGMLHGGARSMFGSSAGWGELLGAIFAAIFGVIGLSLFSLLALQITHVLYGTLHTMTDNLIGVTGTSDALNNAVGEFLKPTGWLSKLPIISGFFADMISNGIASLLSYVMAFLIGIFLLPNFVKIPIEAFATWISSLPNTLAQKAQDIEYQFTGTYRSGGGSTGALAGAMDRAGGSMLNSGAAVAAGAGMIAGAAVKAGGGAIANKVGEKLGIGGKDGGGEDTEKKETGSVAVPEDEKTDVNGNPITENVSDSEETVEGATLAEENSQEGDAVGGDTESDESVTSDDDRTDGDAVGGDVNAEESSVSDMNSAEGDAVDGDVNAEDSVASDVSAVEGDSSSEDSSVNDENNAQGDAVSGDVNAEDSSVNDENNAQGDAVSGDVNAEDSSVSDENNTQGDINDDRSAVSDENNTQGDVSDGSSSVSDETNTQGDVSDGSSAVAGDVSSSDDSVSGETTSEGDAVGGDTSADGDSVSSNDSSVEGGTSSSVAGGTSTNSSSVAGGTSSSVAGGTSASNSSVAGGTSSSNSSVAGGTSSSDSSAEGDAVGGDVNASNATAGGDVNASNATAGGDVNASNATAGGDVNTSDSVTGGTSSATDSTVGGESVSEGSSNIGGDTSATSDVNTSDSTVGSEGSGQGSSVSDGSANSGTNYESHSESSAGGPVSEGGVSDGGTSITNDGTTEGAQVSNDTTTADANVSQDASASINQSTEDRTMHQEGNADNRQSADVNSNSQTVNDSQSTVAGGSPTTGAQGSATSTGKQGSVTSTGKQGSATSTGKQGGATTTGKQGGATPTGKQGSATSTGKQGGATTTGKQGGATSTGKQGSATSTGKQGSATSTGKQRGATSTGKQGSATSTGKQGGTTTTGKQGGATSTGKQRGASTAQTGNQGRSATAPTGQQSNATPTGQQRNSATSPTGQQRNATTAPTGQQRGTQQGQKGTATIDSRGTVTSSNQGSQSKGGNESTSAKAGRLGRMFNGAKNSTAKQGNVSNAQQAAMGAVHVMGGLTGAQNITQKGVDNLKRRQGKDVDAKNGKNNAGQNASNPSQNERQQQIIDMERREQDERDEQRGNKKPSFIQSIRDNKK